MNIKVIAIDIDGTLLTDKGKILDDTRETIIQAQEKGIKVVLATGRAPSAALLYAKQLKLDEYAQHIICFNGCVIYDLKTKKNIWNAHLNEEDTKYIYEIIKKYDLNFWGYGLKNSAYTRKKSVAIMREAKINPKYKLKVLNDCQALPACYTLTISLDDLEDKICENFKIEIEANKRIRITSSSLEKYQYLDIMPANFDKSKALKFLVNKWHLKLKNCMAIGDSLNDYEMLQKAGLGIMMKNGYSDLIKVATDMCDSNNKNGVGKAILKYILK